MINEFQKSDIIEKSIEWWNPDKTNTWKKLGVDVVIDKREGYFFYDINGKRLMNVHLNGGTYNFGHRNREIIDALQLGLQRFDIGNHHFPSITRALLAEEIAKITPIGLKYSVFSSGGGEAIDAALKCARNATNRKKVISIKHSYHGHTGLAVALGDERFSAPFLSNGSPDEFVQVPFNNEEAIENALSKGDAACVIMETIPATYGFPIPKEGYLQLVKSLCEKYGSLYIADEVQTGLYRTGKMWGIEHFQVTPDILVTAKGLSGGIYPIAATVVNERAGKWLVNDGSAHMSTFGGAELGCIVALKVLEMCQRPEIQENIHNISQYLRAGLEGIKSQVPEFFIGIRQLGLVMGLEFNHPEGAKYVMKSLYEHGVWAIYSMLDPAVLQFKPGLLCDYEFCDELLMKMELGIKQAWMEIQLQPLFSE